MITPKYIIHQYLRAYCDRIEPQGLAPESGLIYFFEPHAPSGEGTFSIREDNGVFVGVGYHDAIGEDHELIDLKAVQGFVHMNYV